MIYIVLGTLLYFAVVSDIIKTTLSLHGGGWLTSPIAHGLWRVCLKLAGGNGRVRFLEHAGYLILLSILSIWVFCLWLSFFLLLLSQPGSILSSSTRLPADVWEKLYFAGFTLSTLGVGDFVAATNSWKVVTIIYSLTGLVMITLSISYIMPVISGVILQEKLALSLRSLGASPEQMVLNSWDGKSFQHLLSRTSDLADTLLMHSQNHKAYPIIHFYHSRHLRNSILVQIATFHEAFLIINHFVKKELRPDPQNVSKLTTAFAAYFEVISSLVDFRKLKREPSYPAFNRLLEKGLLDEASSAQVLPDEVRQNRKVLAGLLQQDGWSWQDLRADN